MSISLAIILGIFIFFVGIFIWGLCGNRQDGKLELGAFGAGVVALLGLLLYCGANTWKTATFETKEYSVAATENHILVESFGLVKQFDSIKDKNLLEKNGKVWINQSVNHYGAWNGTWIALEPLH